MTRSEEPLGEEQRTASALTEKIRHTGAIEKAGIFTMCKVCYRILMRNSWK
jgi:hypothetical protein